MGFGTRIRNGIAKAIAPPKSTIPPPHTPSYDLHGVRAKINNMPLSEMVPGMMSPGMGGLSMPVWGPEINSIGAYSREGYTSKTFDTPKINFRAQETALQLDEDVQLAINDLASKVTGGQHYMKAASEELIEYFEDFSNKLDFDIFDTELVKELLWYGNSVWKPRMGIRNVHSIKDLMHIPISSFVRVWWDRQRIPYKYEFRGAEYQGYHNPGEIMHFNWNPVNASVFGTGFGVSVTSTREFTQPVPGGGFEDFELPSMLERKYATQYNMQLAEQRYISANLWTVEDGDENTRADLKSQVENKTIGQDVIAGTKVEVKELGSNSRNFNADQFAEITQGSLFKALNDFRGKQAGASTHSFANAERAALLDELGLTAFPIAVKTQLRELLFKPWYLGNPLLSRDYFGGIIPIQWTDCEFKINFGQVEKKDITVEDMIKLIQLYLQSPVPKDPKQILKLFEQAGLPIDDSYLVTINNMYNDPTGAMAMQQAGIPQSSQQSPPQSPQPQLPPNSDMGGGPISPTPQFNNQNMGTPPMDNPNYDSMMKDVRGGNPFVKSNFRQSNQSQDWNNGRNYE